MKLKKIISVLTAVVMVLALSATAFADDIMTPIPLTQDNQGSFGTDTTYTETGFSVADGQQASFKLPQSYAIGETLLVHIKGSAESNFRIFLVKNGWDRASNIVTLSDDGVVPGYTGGEFDIYITFVVEDAESKGVDVANEINFKGPTYDTNLVNLSVEVCEIFVGDVEAYKAAGGTACAIVGHTITEYVSNNDATCEEDGTKTATCSVCGETDTVDDEGTALGHNYVDGVCTNCGEADPATVEEEAPAEDASSSTSSSSSSAATVVIIVTVVVVVAIIVIVIVVIAKSSKGKKNGADSKKK